MALVLVLSLLLLPSVHERAITLLGPGVIVLVVLALLLLAFVLVALALLLPSVREVVIPLLDAVVGAGVCVVVASRAGKSNYSSWCWCCCFGGAGICVGSVGIVVASSAGSSNSSTW